MTQFHAMTQSEAMPPADTPMPGEDPGALIEDADRLDEIEPPADAGPVKEETPGAVDVERQRA